MHTVPFPDGACSCDDAEAICYHGAPSPPDATAVAASPPTAPPGATARHVVSLTAVVDVADGATLDQDLYRQRLASTIEGVEAADITLVVEAAATRRLASVPRGFPYRSRPLASRRRLGSLSVTALIAVADASAAEAVTAALQVVAATPQSLSSALGVSVTSVSAPVYTAPPVDQTPSSPAPPGASAVIIEPASNLNQEASGTGEEGQASVVDIAIGASAGAIALLAIAAWWRRQRRHQRPIRHVELRVGEQVAVRPSGGKAGEAVARDVGIDVQSVPETSVAVALA